MVVVVVVVTVVCVITFSAMRSYGAKGGEVSTFRELYLGVRHYKAGLLIELRTLGNNEDRYHEPMLVRGRRPRPCDSSSRLRYLPRMTAPSAPDRKNKNRNKKIRREVSMRLMELM